MVWVVVAYSSGGEVSLRVFAERSAAVAYVGQQIPLAQGNQWEAHPDGTYWCDTYSLESFAIEGHEVG